MWAKIGQIVIPILLAVLISVLGFLFAQNLNLKSEMACLALAEANHHAEVKQELALQALTLSNVADKVDKITLITWRHGNE